MAYEGMIAETITITGDKNEPISAYVARPLGPGPFPGMVLLHHAPGWDEWYREATRKFAHHGYAAISPNLYHRAGEGKADDVAAKVRAEGGVARRAGHRRHRGLGGVAARPALAQRQGRCVRHLLRRAANLSRSPATPRTSTPHASFGAAGW